MGVRVLDAMGMAVEMDVRPIVMRVQVQVPAAARVAQHHRRAEGDEEECDQEVGCRPEPIGEVEAEQDDRGHYQADARRVADGPDEPEAARVHQTRLPRREGRDRGQVVRLERVS